MMLHQAIRKSKSGDVVEVFATDNSTSWDIPKFCTHLGHELLLQEERLDENGHKEFHYLVKKG
jgi:tRNA 2-thiouridine synthesizing protein A